ncbi:MAG: hypothetical protein B1H04_05440 [Planctomycetales bacterium 4484_123]|nr:MAG: hypothetical protein B1H04_05440 [Planctomycetales bacterium 4484_123]
MVEFTLVVPILAVILSLVFFFGWSLMHKHQVIVADRYAAWQRIETGRWPGTDKLNESFFANKALDVSLGGAATGRRTATELAGAAGDLNRRSGSLAEELLLDRFPTGRRAHVSAKFHGHQALWEREGLIGYIHSRHGREGITWRRDEVRPWRVLRDQFYQELDEALQRVPAPGDGMAQMIRGLYLAHW